MAVFLPLPAAIRPQANFFHFAKLAKQVVIITMLKQISRRYSIRKETTAVSSWAASQCDFNFSSLSLTAIMYFVQQ